MILNLAFIVICLQKYIKTARVLPDRIKNYYCLADSNNKEYFFFRGKLQNNWLNIFLFIIFKNKWKS